MADEKVTLSRPVEPVQVAVIGTGDGSRLASGMEAKTAGANEPNLVVTVISPMMALAIRFANAYLTSFVGMIGLAQTKKGAELIGAGDFGVMVATCASLALAGPVIDLVKNLITILGRLERKYPLLTGSV